MADPRETLAAQVRRFMKAAGAALAVAAALLLLDATVFAAVALAVTAGLAGTAIYVWAKYLR